MEYKHYIKTYQDFPKQGILFYDLSPLFLDPNVLQSIAYDFAEKVKDLDYDLIAGIESRGFLFGAMLALYCKKGFIMMRKPGKLPGLCEEVSFSLEYGSSNLSVQHDSIKTGQKILIVDDVLATGGTARAATQLVQSRDAQVAGYLFMMEISQLNGRSLLLTDAPAHALITL